MKRIVLIFVAVVVVPHFVYSQRHEWTLVTAGGSRFQDIHPDTIRGDSLGFSNNEGGAFWLPLDSVRGLRYRHNPLILPLMLIGGVIGGVGNQNVLDEGGGGEFSLTGAVIGSLVGAFLAYVFEDAYSEEILSDGMAVGEKREAIRIKVPRWTGRVILVE